MSFMFHPYPYADPEAVNSINIPESVKKNLSHGILNVAKSISALFESGTKTIGIDAYPGTEYETLINVLRQQLAAKNIEFIDAASVLLPSEVITEKIKPYLPEDRDYDRFSFTEDGIPRAIKDCRTAKRLQLSMKKSKTPPDLSYSAKVRFRRSSRIHTM